MGPPRVPVRHSLLTRLLATSILVAGCAVPVTAWLATRTATNAIRQEQGQSLADDKGVYDQLLGYAATHHTWDGVDPLVREQAARLGRRITLLADDQQTIADSAPGAFQRTTRPAAIIDALHVDVALTGGDQHIDPRAVGPYILPVAERTQLKREADAKVACIRGLGFDAAVIITPSGRPTVRVLSADGKHETAACTSPLEFATSSEERPLGDLTRRAGICLGLPPAKSILILPDFTSYPANSGATNTQISRCVDQGRRAQLARYVAPPAQLFVTATSDGAATTFTLSSANLVRIGTGTGAVLVVAIVVTVLAGRRLVRPLRALTHAALQPVDRQRPVTVRNRDEIGYLARAFNDLDRRRRHAEQQRQQLVADVAHELRTPLTVIQGRLESAEDGFIPIDADLVRLVRDETVLLHHLVDDLRDLAAADAGNFRIQPQATSIDRALRHVVAAHQNAAQTAGIRLHHITSSDATVMVDPVRLHQLVGNLISNAIRHTPSGGTVTVACTIDAEVLTLKVTDTGAGIAPDDLPKVFDRFWRAERSRSRATGGSGLGLAIARKIAEGHGGGITATSRVGKGSEFTVQIPVSTPRRNATADPRREGPPS